jgi:hypothetical protein
MLLMCLVPLCVQAQKIKVEYNKAIDFSKYKTFAWAPIGAVSRPMLAAAIQGAIQDELIKRGLSKTDGIPDLVIEIYGSVDSDMQVTFDNPLYAGIGGVPDFGTGFVMWGFTPGGSSSVIVHKGQLVVDLLDFSQRKLVWRAVATDNLSSNPDKLVGQVNDTAAKMLKEYPIKSGK